MKKATKKQTLLALAAGLTVVVTGAAMTRQNASANESENTFAMITGASIRLDSENYGLRFAAEVPTAELSNNETYHMVVFPASYVTKYSLTSESDFVAVLDEKEEDGAKYIDMPCLVYSPDTTVGIFEAGKNYVRGSVTSIAYSHIDGDFFGIAYKATTAASGDVTREYASYTEGENVRNIVQVASTVLYDGVYEEESEEFDICSKIFNQAVNRSNGVDEENKDKAHAAFALLTEYSIALGDTKQFTPTKLTSAKYAWSSSNESVATVAQDGTVTPVSVGSTTVTYKIANETVTCKVEITREHRFDSLDKVKFVGADVNKSIVDATEEGIGLPSGETSKKVVKLTLDIPEGDTKGDRSIYPVIDISSITHAMDDAAYSFDYISVKLYTKAVVFQSTTNTGLTNNANGDKKMDNWKKITVEQITYATNRTDNVWVEWKIPVANVKAAYEEGYDYLTLFHWIDKSNFDKAWYFHSWELVQEPNVRFDDLSTMNFRHTPMTISVVDVEEEGIGLPTGVTGNTVVKGVFNKTDANDQTMYATIDLTAVIERFEQLNDNDYVSLWVYTQSPLWFNSSNFRLTNKATGEVNKSDETLKNLAVGDTTYSATNKNLGWIELTISVKTIKDAYADGCNWLRIDNWRGNNSSSGGANNLLNPFYFHSWTLVKAD